MDAGSPDAAEPICHLDPIHCQEESQQAAGHRPGRHKPMLFVLLLMLAAAPVSVHGEGQGSNSRGSSSRGLLDSQADRDKQAVELQACINEGYTFKLTKWNESVMNDTLPK
jgi:hypothetical protein